MSIATQEKVAAPAARGWLGRNWKWFLPGMFAVSVAMAAIAVFSYVQVRSFGYRQNPAYQAALAEVQANKQIRDRLGEPIVDSDWNPQGAIELRDNSTMGEARFNFTVSGPKGRADVGADGRMVDAEWALSRLRVRFPNDEEINLTKQVLAKQKADTPAFDAEKEKQRKSAADKPKESTEVNVEVPDLPPGLK